MTAVYRVVGILNLYLLNDEWLVDIKNRMLKVKKKAGTKLE